LWVWDDPVGRWSGNRWEFKHKQWELERGWGYFDQWKRDLKYRERDFELG
jgi:hypothetical protein